MSAFHLNLSLQQKSKQQSRSLLKLDNLRAAPPPARPLEHIMLNRICQTMKPSSKPIHAATTAINQVSRAIVAAAATATAVPLPPRQPHRKQESQQNLLAHLFSNPNTANKPQQTQFYSDTFEVASVKEFFHFYKSVTGVKNNQQRKEFNEKLSKKEHRIIEITESLQKPKHQSSQEQLRHDEQSQSTSPNATRNINAQSKLNNKPIKQHATSKSFDPTSLTATAATGNQLTNQQQFQSSTTSIDAAIPIEPKKSSYFRVYSQVPSGCSTPSSRGDHMMSQNNYQDDDMQPRELRTTPSNPSKYYFHTASQQSELDVQSTNNLKENKSTQSQQNSHLNTEGTSNTNKIQDSLRLQVKQQSNAVSESRFQGKTSARSAIHSEEQSPTNLMAPKLFFPSQFRAQSARIRLPLHNNSNGNNNTKNKLSKQQQQSSRVSEPSLISMARNTSLEDEPMMGVTGGGFELVNQRAATTSSAISEPALMLRKYSSPKFSNGEGNSAAGTPMNRSIDGFNQKSEQLLRKMLPHPRRTNSLQVGGDKATTVVEEQGDDLVEDKQNKLLITMKYADKFLDTHDVFSIQKGLKVYKSPFVDTVFKNATSLDAFVTNSIDTSISLHKKKNMMQLMRQQSVNSVRTEKTPTGITTAAIAGSITPAGSAGTSMIGGVGGLAGSQNSSGFGEAIHHAKKPYLVVKKLKDDNLLNKSGAVDTSAMVNISRDITNNVARIDGILLKKSSLVPKRVLSAMSGTRSQGMLKQQQQQRKCLTRADVSKKYSIGKYFQIQKDVQSQYVLAKRSILSAAAAKKGVVSCLFFDKLDH